jgi:hypothetical protein
MAARIGTIPAGLTANLPCFWCYIGNQVTKHSPTG